jgi:hypothetical protein
MIRDCVCSDCWGDLVGIYSPKTRMKRVQCSTENCPNHGVVSKKFVEKREQKSQGELIEAKTALKAAGVLRTTKTAQQILSELGF